MAGGYILLTVTSTVEKSGPKSCYRVAGKIISGTIHVFTKL
jgi:hypothetical protein